jgi:hypothetical protein
MGRGGNGDESLNGSAPRRQGSTVVVAGSDGCSYELEPGVLDERAEAAFLHGQCHALALALHERTGWPIIGVEDEELDICHFHVQTPCGRALDITGAHEIDDYLELEHVDYCPELEYLVEQGPEYVASLGSDPNWRAPRLDVARSFVEALLAREGLDAEASAAAPVSA